MRLSPQRGELAIQLVFGKQAFFDNELADRAHPALVIAKREIFCARQRFDRAAHGVHRVMALLGMREQPHHCVDALVEERAFVLGKVQRTGGLAAQIMYSAGHGMANNEWRNQYTPARWRAAPPATRAQVNSWSYCLRADATSSAR